MIYCFPPYTRGLGLWLVSTSSRHLSIGKYVQLLAFSSMTYAVKLPKTTTVSNSFDDSSVRIINCNTWPVKYKMRNVIQDVKLGLGPWQRSIRNELPYGWEIQIIWEITEKEKRYPKVWNEQFSSETWQHTFHACFGKYRRHRSPQAKSTDCCKRSRRLWYPAIVGSSRICT